MPNRDMVFGRNDRQPIAFSDKCKSKDDSATLSSGGSELAMGVLDNRVITFVQVAEQNRGRLLWVAQRMTFSRDIAEDIVQEALLKAFRGLQDFRGQSQMSTWLRAIVQNTAREYLRNQRGREILSLDFGRNGDEDATAHDFPDSRKSPEEYCERNEMEGILISEIDALSTFCKRAIQMCVLEELPHVAAAAALNTSVSSIKSRIFRGKRVLKRTVCLRIGRNEMPAPVSGESDSSGFEDRF